MNISAITVDQLYADLRDMVTQMAVLEESTRELDIEQLCWTLVALSDDPELCRLLASNSPLVSQASPLRHLAYLYRHEIDLLRGLRGMTRLCAQLHHVDPKSLMAQGLAIFVGTVPFTPQTEREGSGPESRRNRGA
jgi:hypothetical protein